MAIGESDAAAVAQLAVGHGLTEEDRFCTWYVNRGNGAAEQLFRQIYLPNPADMSPSETSAIYGNRLAPAFTEGPDSFWRCLGEKGFLAIGCNGQKHRGPTVFGMVLATFGCSPEHAAEIVNRLWGLNGVPAETRLAVIRQAHEFGTCHPGLRSRLQQRLSESPPAPAAVRPEFPAGGWTRPAFSERIEQASRPLQVQPILKGVLDGSPAGWSPFIPAAASRIRK